MNQPAYTPPITADDSHAGRSGAAARPRRRWRRWSVAAMMALVAVVAVGMAVFERSRRLRIVIGNATEGTIRSIMVTHAGRQATLGPIGPRSAQEVRMATDRGDWIETSGEFEASPTIKCPHISSRTRTKWEYGQTIRFDYDGAGTVISTAH